MHLICQTLSGKHLIWWWCARRARALLVRAKTKIVIYSCCLMQLLSLYNPVARAARALAGRCTVRASEPREGLYWFSKFHSGAHHASLHEAAAGQKMFYGKNNQMWFCLGFLYLTKCLRTLILACAGAREGLWLEQINCGRVRAAYQQVGPGGTRQAYNLKKGHRNSLNPHASHLLLSPLHHVRYDPSRAASLMLPM